MKKRALIIIGSGAAGLAAANRLAEEFDVTVLEALDRCGGRIHSLADEQVSGPIEAGAEFIHGNLPLTLQLAKEAGATLEPVEGSMFRVQHCEWTAQTEMIAGWQDLLDKMNEAPEDITLDALLEMHYTGSEHEALRRQAREYAAGFDLADPTKVGIKSLYREWTSEQHEQYRIKEGYHLLIDHLHHQCIDKGCQVLVGKKVTRIDWRKNFATVQTADGEIFRASKVIITLPAGIMQKKAAKAAIQLSPALDEYIDAYRKIGFGSVVKIALRFYESFWKEKEDLGFIISEEIIPTWWTQSHNSPVLTGWLGGPAAVQWSGIPEETILDHAIHSLAAIFKMTAEEIRNKLLTSHIFNWHTVETACGAYSYETPLSAGARLLLQTPVENTIYFAGEALYDGNSPGTVEAALNSGYTVAGKISEESIFQQPAEETATIKSSIV